MAEGSGNQVGNIPLQNIYNNIFLAEITQQKTLQVGWGLTLSSGAAFQNVKKLGVEQHVMFFKPICRPKVLLVPLILSLFPSKFVQYARYSLNCVHN